MCVSYCTWDHNQNGLCCLLCSVTSVSTLYLETSRLSSTSGLLELSALGSNSGSSGRSWGTRSLTEVSLSGTGLGGSSEENGVGALRGSQSELVESDALTTSLDDASSGGLSELKSADGHLGDLEKASIIGNGGDDDGSLSGVGLHVGDQLRKRQRGSVSSRSDQSLHNGLVELGASSASEKLVKLNQESNVRVIRLGLLSAGSASSATTLKINSHGVISYNSGILGRAVKRMDSQVS